MTEAMIVEAIRAAGGAPGVGAPQQVQAVADPQAVAAFEKAMAADGVSAVPMVSQIAETWRSAQIDQQGILHRMTALSDMMTMDHLSAAQLTQLQYEVANFAFQQEIVTNIAKKATDAISTLVKNG